MMIEKRFPADTSRRSENITFLNNKDIDGELYGYLQSISMPEKMSNGQYLTVVYKKSIPTQKELGKKLKMTDKTVRSHFSKLIVEGYLIQRENGDYILPNKENSFLMIPLDTVKYLSDCCKEHIFKIYIYLVQKYKFYQTKMGIKYEFTYKEIIDMLGYSTTNKAYNDVIKHALELLSNSGLIEYVSFYNGQAKRMKLVGISYNYKKEEKMITNKNAC